MHSGMPGAPERLLGVAARPPPGAGRLGKGGESMALSLYKKAKLIIYSESGSEKESITCSFNPSQYAIRNTTNYKEDSSLGNDVSRLMYLSGNRSELTLTLYFDSATDDSIPLMAAGIGTDELAGAVTDKTKKITKAMRVEGSQHRPPYVAFQWGNLKFKGVITSMNETFIMFSPSGKPIRSKVDLTIKSEESASMVKQSEPFESPDRTKAKVVIQGMSLWQIAYEEYGDASKWRLIARANGMMNPLDLKPGQTLKIPAL